MTRPVEDRAVASIEDQGLVTLGAGKWEGQPLIVGGASVPSLRLSEGFRLTGDLDQDGADEAVVHLAYSSGGTGNFGYLAVMGREGGEVVREAIGIVGDRVQIRGARIDGGSVVLDVLQAGPDDGMCCPRQLATRTFGIRSGTLVETAAQVTATPHPQCLTARNGCCASWTGGRGKGYQGRRPLPSPPAGSWDRPAAAGSRGPSERANRRPAWSSGR